MRVFELSTHVQSISRGDGRSATAAAAYRACCVIECEREGRTHDYTRKRGLEASAIILPKGAPAWAADRAKLWNAAEMRERNGKRGPNAGQFKKDAKIAREFLFAFPVELSAAGRLKVAEAVARHFADKHGMAADFSIHEPGKEGDQRNHHCHCMVSSRRLTAKGFGDKAREWDDLKTGADLGKAWRALVAQTMNEVLAEEGKAGVAFVEHRSFKARGSSQVPTRHQGVKRTNIERKDRKQLRDVWERQTRKEQRERHAKESVALKTRQDFALSSKLGDIAERERKGIEAIRRELVRTLASDTGPKGMRAFFERVAGGKMRADFERQARAAEHSDVADRAIAGLKASAQAERNAFANAQIKERGEMETRHTAEDRQIKDVVSTRASLDRVVEVEARRAQVRDLQRDRQQVIEGPGLSPW